MELESAIYERRSVRSYTSRRVDDPTVDELLRAAAQAPSAMNSQPWAFAVVQNAAQLARYSQRAKTMLLGNVHEQKVRQYAQMLRDDSFNIFYEATTLVVICARERGPFVEAGCWLAAENLLLAAQGLGLATCCIGFAVGVLNEADVKAELKIPDDAVAVAPIIVGIGAASPPAVARRKPEVLSWSR